MTLVILMSIFGFILFFIAGWFGWNRWLILRSKGKIERTINFYIQGGYNEKFKQQEIDLSRDEVKKLMKRLFVNFQQNKVGKNIGKGHYGEVNEYKTSKTKIDVIKKPICCPSKRIMECDAGKNLKISLKLIPYNGSPSKNPDLKTPLLVSFFAESCVEESITSGV